MQKHLLESEVKPRSNVLFVKLRKLTLQHDTTASCQRRIYIDATPDLQRLYAFADAL